MREKGRRLAARGEKEIWINSRKNSDIPSVIASINGMGRYILILLLKINLK